MSKTYADALRYFRTKLKAGPEPDPKLTGSAEHAGTTELLDAGHHEGSPEPQAQKDLHDISSTVRDINSASPGTVSDPEFIVLPDGTKRRIAPQQPTEEIYAWSHVMDYSVFRVKTAWRQQQLIAQWKENEAQGGGPVNLRGGAPRRNCFGCGKGPGFCDCEESFTQ